MNFTATNCTWWKESILPHRILHNKFHLKRALWKVHSPLLNQLLMHFEVITFKTRERRFPLFLYLSLANRMNQIFWSLRHEFLLSKAQSWLRLVLGDDANHLCPVHLLTDWFGSLVLFIFSRLNAIAFVYGRQPVSLW